MRVLFNQLVYALNMLAIKLLTLLTGCVFANAAVSYEEVLGGRCFPPGTNPIAQTSAINTRQCAIQCAINGLCSAFQFVQSDLSCLLFNSVQISFSLNSTVGLQNNCAARTFAGDVKTAGQAIFTDNGQLAVFAKTAKLNVIAIGGGSGGCAACNGGGGGGYVSFATLNVSAGQTFTVTVGSGGSGGKAGKAGTALCNGATNGSDSSFGDILVARGGTNSASANGGNGGSGGGSGTCGYNGWLSGRGGSAGSAGQNTNSSFTGGSGQGGSFTSWFSQFKLTSITAGMGPQGTLGDSRYRYGGGGGGGILLNGTGPSSGAGGCCNSYSCGPSNATGYGAGGSAACRDVISYDYYAGGDGSGGLVYIEFSEN